jgi:UPF0042 nucleotide-binding protein
MIQLILISGLSGSGKSIALNALEDAGFFCVDNLPAALLNDALALYAEHGGRIAISIDTRSPASLTVLPSKMAILKANGIDVRLLYLEAKHEVLVKRFSETRRRHPLSHTGLTVAECIYKERELLEHIAELGTRIDTSHISSNILKTWIKSFIHGDKQRVNLIFESFGFKHGVPLDADFVFDVRCLPNPYYEVSLRSLTGQDQAIIDFFADKSAVHEMTADIEAYVRKWLPAFAAEHRSYLTVAIGCTGGQHRSVFIAETLAQRFAAESVLLRHRQLGI